MSGIAWATGLSAAGAVALLLRPPAPAVAPPRAAGDDGVIAAPVTDPGWMRRWRVLLALSAAVGALTFLGGVAGLLAAPVAAVGTWVAIARIEPAGVRRAREQVARELPHLVRLLGTALSAGTPPAAALEIVGEALPGPASDRLRPVATRLRLGADPAAAWAALAADPVLAPLGRALSRAEDGGLSVAATIARLADDLAQRERAEVERRARAVGVKAAVPLGLCLLPAFLLIGIVPLVGGLITTIAW
ncbi:MAG: type II secretion system F family protein [Nocardioides sp.]